MQRQPNPNELSLWRLSHSAGESSERWLWGLERSVCLNELSGGTYFPLDREATAGRSVLILTGDQISTVLALFELDGAARRVVLCPPDFSLLHLRATMATASIDLIVCDHATSDIAVDGVEKVVMLSELRAVSRTDRPVHECTEWVLLTSGTTGAPKLVAHTLISLTGAFSDRSVANADTIWSTFYDVRRFGGLQILLRTIHAGSSMVISDPAEIVSSFLFRAAAHGVTHISGTPSQWRRAMIAPSLETFAPTYIRLSGEIADQSVLDRIHSLFPDASIAHAFASTEAGVAFEVTDGLAGFPASIIDRASEPVSIAVRDGALLIKSDRSAVGYLGANAPCLHGTDGFVNTGDLVDLRGGRYYFVGRRDGVINIGGLKVHPEEVEAVINQHPSVRICQVKGRSNAITGGIVTANVVIDLDNVENKIERAEVVRDEIMSLCRRSLARHKIPALLRFVNSLEYSSSGKVGR